LAAWFPVYPKHIYGKENKTWDQMNKYVDTNPIGTGPGKLISFGAQKIKIGIRDDWWGCKSEEYKDTPSCKGDGVKEVDIVPTGTAGNVQSKITRGEIDYAEGSSPGVATKFTEQSPDNNHYDYYANGGVKGVAFGCTVKPTDDANVRKALRESVDLTIAQKVVDNGYSIPTITGINGYIYPKWTYPGYSEQLTPNIDKAKQYLKDGGYTINAKGNLVKNGTEYPLSVYYSINNADDPYVATIIPTITAEWKKNLGLNVALKPTNDTVFKTTTTEKHSYQMFYGGVITTMTPWLSFGIYKQEWLTQKYQEMSYGNAGLYHIGDAANKVLKGMVNVSAFDTSPALKSKLDIVQKDILNGAPYIPVLSTGVGVMWTTKNWTNFPIEDTSKYDYKPAISFDAMSNFIQTVIHLKKAS
jgi:peptide/nickel transport system substrate-binding protein